MLTTATLSALLVIGGVGPKTVTFPSGDGFEITADIYPAAPAEAPFIVLFHQASWSRGEYRARGSHTAAVFVVLLDADDGLIPGSPAASCYFRLPTLPLP